MDRPKVEIKTVRQSNLLHGKMYHIANGRDWKTPSSAVPISPSAASAWASQATTSN